MIKYFAVIVARKAVTYTRTIVPPGAKFIIYEITIPISTDKMAIEIDINAVFLKPFPNSMAVIFGITINDDISKKDTPTNRIDAITVMSASTMKR